ncbi:hypothetical protein PRIPAC_75077 [Pristionchus pacificus]|uniref:Uncharacterized protein n=1 Tax=Pristionchus pacificus TaxID=54126 RepID=A0A2A6CF71_PRIPA|nr:hypothetical protein PRIPAC_75077 [Pristionchus pacificus]|eukprot:PDM76842.1 hypothetical protein PRIPAC_42237 [Pristionchus pacificus]
MILLLTVTFLCQALAHDNCLAGCVITVKRKFAESAGRHQSPFSSTDLLSPPFHSTIAEHDDITNMFHKIRKTCGDVKYFDGCLSRCDLSREQQMLQHSIHHWKFFCSAVSNSNARGVRDYILCERTHLRRATLNCSPINIRDLNTTSVAGLSQFCELVLSYDFLETSTNTHEHSVDRYEGNDNISRHFDRYQKCFHRERPDCTPQAVELKQRIEVALQQTYEKLISASDMTVPHLCSQWRRAMPSDIVAPDATEKTIEMAYSSTLSETRMSTSMTTTPTSVAITAIDYMVTEARKSTSPAVIQMMLPVQMTDAPVVTLNAHHQASHGSILKENSRSRRIYDTLTGPHTSSNVPLLDLISIIFTLFAIFQVE